LPKFTKVNNGDDELHPLLGFLAKYEGPSKKKILTGNKVQVAKLYQEYLPLRGGLSVTAPFYDATSGIKKSDYHKNLIKYLKELIVLIQTSTSTIPQFDVSKIKGALSFEVYQHSEHEDEVEDEIEIENKDEFFDIQNQLVSLRNIPHLSSELCASKHQTLESIEVTTIFSRLMSTCYKSIHKADITTYHSEIARRASLRSLFEFQRAYAYMKEWVIKFASRSKGKKSSTQVRALLTGKNTLQDFLDINKKELGSFKIQSALMKDSYKRKKTISETNLVIDIPGFSGKISSRKLSTFIAAGPRLMQLLEILNKDWVTLDLIDDVTVTWLENFRKEEWEEFINIITTQK
jgi:hypothetical protein